MTTALLSSIVVGFLVTLCTGLLLLTCLKITQNRRNTWRIRRILEEWNEDWLKLRDARGLVLQIHEENPTRHTTIVVRLDDPSWHDEPKTITLDD